MFKEILMILGEEIEELVETHDICDITGHGDSSGD